MAERSCVHPYIDRLHRGLDSGSSLRSSLKEIPFYQDAVIRVYGRLPSKLHRLATSSSSLTLLTIYEYTRHKGIPLPDSRTLITKFLPLKRRSRVAMGGKNIIDTKHQLLD